MQRRRIFKAKEEREVVSPSIALKYTFEFGLMILFFSTGQTGSALALGLFAGLTYARQNLLITAPLFVVAGSIFIDSWWSLVFLAIPPIAFTILYFVYSRLKRNVPTWAVVLTTLLCALTEGIARLFLFDEGFRLALIAVLSVVFALCCTNACYAVLIRGIKCRFTLDEQICLSIFCVAFAYASYGVNVYGFRLYFLILPFALLCFTWSGKGSLSLIVGLLFSLGATLSSLDFALVGVSVILAFACTSMKVFSRFVSTVAMAVITVVFWLLKCGVGYESAILVLVSGLTYSFLPRDVRGKFARSSQDKADTLCAMVNRDRMNLSNRLLSVSDVFADLSECLDDQDSDTNPYTAKRLSKEVAKNYCGKCPERNKCFSALGTDTSSVVEPLCSAALSRGKATILDVPNFVSSRCVKTHNLLSVVNNAAQSYKAKIVGSKELVSCKKMMSEQFAGMSLVLDALSRECGKNLTFAGEREEKLENELMKHNIVASETVVVGSGSSSRVALTVREKDAGKTMLVKTVSKCLKNSYAIDKITDKGEEKTVHLVTAPVFQVAYGVAEKKRDNEVVSGDSIAVLSPSLNKKIFALSDGMGSGDKASFASTKSLNMIENFYRAGFEDNLILSLVNQLLGLAYDDNFSALDIAVVDTADGGVDIIKLGATAGFIVRKTEIEVLKSSSPPVGVVDKINPITRKYQLYDGDMLVMVSDGITDVLGENGLVELVREVDTANPQILADKILLSAVNGGAEDDCTAMVLRLVAQ